MNVQQFIKKWHKSTLKERSASQSHFNDLCALLGEPTPTDVDPDGTWYTFERGAKKTGWALAVGSTLEDRPVYATTTCFETFPFPAGLTPADNVSLPPLQGEGAKARISTAARRLNELRENWLNPPEWVDWVRTPEEEKAGYPARPVAKVDADVGRDSSRLVGLKSDLQKRTLTNLYNARPAWLDHAHKELDSAVAAAYGWVDYTSEMADEEILRRLLALNLARAG